MDWCSRIDNLPAAVRQGFVPDPGYGSHHTDADGIAETDRKVR